VTRSHATPGRQSASVEQGFPKSLYQTKSTCLSSGGLLAPLTRHCLVLFLETGVCTVEGGAQEIKATLFGEVRRGADHVIARHLGDGRSCAQLTPEIFSLSFSFFFSQRFIKM
jgi:hypothetical protein